MTVSAPQLGKTLGLALWLLAGSWQDGGRSRWASWWTAPIYDQARHGFLNYVVALARSAGVLAKHTTQPPLKATLINGSVIEARSWDSPEGLYGPPVSRIAGDEFGYMTPEAWAALSSRTTETAQHGLGYIRLAGNVSEIGGEAESLWNTATSGRPGWACRSWTWRDRAAAAPCACDNGASLPIDLDRAPEHAPTCQRGLYLTTIADRRAQLSEAHFRQLYGAEWIDWTSLPVYSFERSLHVADEIALQPSLPLDLSCDFNVDPMGWVVGQHKGREAWALDEICLEGHATTQAACQEFIRRYPWPKLDVDVYGDASGKAKDTRSKQSDYDIIRSMLGAHYRQVRMHVPAANPAVVARVNAVNAKLKSADGSVSYRVAKQCQNLALDLARGSYKPGTRDLDKSDRRRTHFSDADGYRLVTLYPVEQRPVLVRPRPDPGFAASDQILGATF